MFTLSTTSDINIKNTIYKTSYGNLQNTFQRDNKNEIKLGYIGAKLSDIRTVSRTIYAQHHTHCPKPNPPE